MDTGRTRISPKGPTLRARSRPKLNRFSWAWAFWIENNIRYNILKNNKSPIQLLAGIQRFTSRTRVLQSRKTRVLGVNFWIPANSCISFCYFSICCSGYYSLFKKPKLSWNDLVLVENELSVWNPCGDILVRPVPMPASQKTSGCLCRAISQQPYDQMQ